METEANERYATHRDECNTCTSDELCDVGEALYRQLHCECGARRRELACSACV